MANVYEYTALWQGFTGAPGYTKFRFSGGDTQTQIDLNGNQMRLFFNSLGPYLSTGHTITIQPNAPYFDKVTGQLLGEAAMSTSPAVVNGASSTAVWMGGVGAMIAWNTNLIWSGHRVKGRSFLVPLRGAADVDGTLLAAFITTVQAAATTLISGTNANFVIWSRQYADVGGKRTQVNGEVGSIFSGIIRDKSGILRSRRD